MRPIHRAFHDELGYHVTLVRDATVTAKELISALPEDRS
jgi:hypothetical protein